MTLPISGGLIKDLFENWASSVNNLKSYCLQAQADTAGGASASIEVFLQIFLGAGVFVAIHDNIAAQSSATINAFVAYAQTQWPATTFTVTDFVNTRDAASAMATTIASVYPHDAQGILLDRSVSGSTLAWVMTTAAAIPTVMSAIASFLATLS